MKRIRKVETPTPAAEAQRAPEPAPAAVPDDAPLARAATAMERAATRIASELAFAATRSLSEKPAERAKPSRFSVTITGRDERGRIESFDIEVKNG